MTEKEKAVVTVLKRIGYTDEEAERVITEAKRKIEAAALIGVAGFWS